MYLPELFRVEDVPQMHALIRGISDPLSIVGVTLPPAAGAAANSPAVSKVRENPF